MRKNSLFFKIRVAFALSAVLITAVFWLIFFVQQKETQGQVHQRLMQAGRSMKHSQNDQNTLNERLKELDFRLATEDEINKTVQNGTLRAADSRGPFYVEFYDYDGRRFIIMKRSNRYVAFEDISEKSTATFFIFAAFLVTFGGLAILYRSILGNLAPITTLKNRVEAYGDGVQMPPLGDRLCEEVRLVSDAFDATTAKLDALSKARSLFLRNIAHELKTPLSKGRFLTEMLPEEGLKERFEMLFVRFDVVIAELLSIENLTSGGVKLNQKEYSIKDLIVEAADTAFLEDENIEIFGSDDDTVFVDFKLFALALKNLLQNGVKFSDTKKVTVEWDSPILTISNEGEPLAMNFDLLSEAFVKGDGSSEGLGLGLYIVRQILTLHDVDISHDYKEGRHYFVLNLGRVA